MPNVRTTVGFGLGMTAREPAATSHTHALNATRKSRRMPRLDNDIKPRATTPANPTPIWFFDLARFRVSSDAYANDSATVQIPSELSSSMAVTDWSGN